MTTPEHIRYVGRMKQPLQAMDVYSPSMFAVSDAENLELCLIILTPGTFCHAFSFIKRSNARSVKIFFPTLRPEFISDIMNLYASLKGVMPVKWVFPENYNHYSFSMGHEKCGVYIHPVDPVISIEYIKNSHVDRLYDIQLKCEEGVHYFSLYTTSEKCTELFYCRQCTFIHVPKSLTVYGGMCYDSLFDVNYKFKRKMVPFDFTSIEEYMMFKGNNIHSFRPAPPTTEVPSEDEEAKYYPGHPPITVEGEPGRAVESDELTTTETITPPTTDNNASDSSNESNSETTQEPQNIVEEVITPKGDDLNDTVQRSE